ncbi:MAG TPA: hypothetical protein VHU80_11350 [Polyangiaceae bacterium]|jgi:hypothetical protein|nr:hypothetical protein [Polyangiaceae bacterium]
MNSPKDLIQHELDNLQQTRDELRVKLHLASEDAKAAWDKIERRWLELEDNAKQMAGSTPSATVGETAKQLVSEIRDSYKKFVTTYG